MFNIHINIDDETPVEKIIESRNLLTTIINQMYPPPIPEEAPVATMVETTAPTKMDAGVILETPEALVLDSEFYPWDKRIHSSSKARNKDGTWKLVKRPKTFDDAESWESFIEQVKAELKGETVEPAFGGYSNQDLTPAPPVIDKPAPPVIDKPAPPVIDKPAPANFAEFMKYVTDHDDVLSIPVVIETCVKYGVANLMELQTKMEVMPTIYNELKSMVES